MVRWPTALALAILIGCGGNDTTSSAADAARADDGAVCEPFASAGCEGEVLRWFDSCGNRGEIAEECLGEDVCVDDLEACCRTPDLEQSYDLGGPNTAAVTLLHPERGGQLSWTVKLEDFEYQAEARGQRLRWVGTIDGRAVQMWVASHVIGNNEGLLGPGVELRVQGGTTPADVEASGGTIIEPTPDGTGQLLRRALPLAEGTTVQMRLVREEADGNADWFAFHVKLDDGAEELIGRGRYPRSGAGAARFETSSDHYLQITRQDLGPFTIPELPTFSVESNLLLMAGDPPTGATLRYPNHGPTEARYTAVDVRYDPDLRLLRFRNGSLARRCTEPGALF